MPFSYVDTPFDYVAVGGVMACAVYILISLFVPSMRKRPKVTYGLLFSFIFVFSMLQLADAGGSMTQAFARLVGWQ